VGVGASGAGPGEGKARQPMQAIKTVTINRQERNFIVNIDVSFVVTHLDNVSLMNSYMGTHAIHISQHGDGIPLIEKLGASMSRCPSQ
jgi:hypothetical protein